MESLYDMFAAMSISFLGEFERLPGYFELSVEFGVRIIVHKGTFTCSLKL
jgi:hypothetical protein